MKKAFTMIELIFIIVIIGILAGVAIPRLAATRDDAELTKAKVLVASVRNSIAMERQKRRLQGRFGPITALTNDSNVFGTFKAINKSGTAVDTGNNVLEYDMPSSSEKGHWELSGGKYIFHGSTADVTFIVDGQSRFVCEDDTTVACRQLTQ